jgi:predicted permease
MDAIMQDVRYAFRVLKKAPGFTVIAALTIGIGIGATTTIFSAVNAVVLQPPPRVRNADQLVRMYGIAEDGSSYHELSYPNYRIYRNAEIGLAGLAAMEIVSASVTADAVEPGAMFGVLVTNNFFDVLGVRAALGRFFLPEEDLPQDMPLVAVLGHATWKRRFGGDSSIVGRTIRINRRPFTVVGVTEEGFRGPAAILDIGVWLPMGAVSVFRNVGDLESRSHASLDVLGRLAPGVTPDQVSVAANLISANVRNAFPENNPEYGIDIQRYASMSRRALGVAAAFSVFLFIVSGTVLLIASINVGSMLLSRSSQRGREIALRLALGAHRMRVVRQLLTESTLLFVLGAGAGALITVYATRLLSTFRLPIDAPFVFDFSPDLRVFAFSLIVALITGVLFGLAPALQVTRPDLNSTLKIGSSSASAARTRLRGAFVVAQVAGSALLLVVAGLFTRGLAHAHFMDPGFDSKNVHVVSSELDFHRNYSDQEAAQFYGDLLERIATLPQVESAAMIDWPPVTFGGQDTTFVLGSHEPTTAEEHPRTDFARVTEAYFQTLHIPIVGGRGFTQADRDGAPMVAIVNQTFARRTWPGNAPLGKRIQFPGPGDQQLEIVGVARDAKYRSLSEDPRNMVYLPYAQWPSADMTILARVAQERAGIAETLRKIVRELDPDLPIDANVPYEEVMGIALLPSRATAVLTTIFGTIGLALASLGLYGVLAYTVTQRTREFGIRLALGAERGEVRTLVLRDGVKLAAVGLAIGLGIALATTHLLRGLLHGLSPMDPITFGGIAVLLIAVAVAASYLPAVRATRTDPVDALRAE